MQPKSNRLKSLEIYYLAFLPFLVYLAGSFMANRLQWPFPLETIYVDRSDGLEYYSIALSLANGHGFSFDGQNPTTMRPPLYPALLALLQLTIGMDWIVFVQQLLTVGIVGLTFYLGKQLGGVKIGILGSAGLALYPPIQLLPFQLLSDTLYIFLLLAGCLLFIRNIEQNQGLALFALTGLVLALAALARPTALFLPLGLLLVKKWQPSVSWKQLGAFAITFYACIAPWSLRNYKVTGRPVLVASLAGFNLWQATYYTNVLHNNQAMWIDPPFMAEFKRLKQDDYFIDHQAEPRFVAAALRRIKAEPLAYLHYCLERTVRCWTAFPGTRDWAGTRPALFWSLALLQTTLVLLGFAGLRKVRGAPRTVLAILLGYIVFFHAFLNLLTRYIIPVQPVLLILALLTLAAFFPSRSAPRAGAQE